MTLACRVWLVLLASVCLGCWATPTFAAEGTPDPSFGSGGVATYELGLGASGVRRSNLAAVGTSRDGTIYVAGESVEEGHTVVLVARANTNGSLDSAFGDGGVRRGATPETNMAARGRLHCRSKRTA